MIFYFRKGAFTMTEVHLFLRETTAEADKANSKKTQHSRDHAAKYVGLDQLLTRLFDVDDWVQDKQIPNSGRHFRPDFRSETLKTIIEFEGLPHYQNPDMIIQDNRRRRFYESLHYGLVEIPYFYQLTQATAQHLFNTDKQQAHLVNLDILPNIGYPSFDRGLRNEPIYLCPIGIARVCHELDYQLEIDPKQFKANIKQLITLDQTHDYSYYPIIDYQCVQNSDIVLPQLMNNARSEYQRLLNQVEGGDN